MRLVALGDACLVEGFRLLGFETFPNADKEQVEALACELLTSKTKALLFIEQTLVNYATSKCLNRIRSESGHIIIVEIPPLHSPGDYYPAVDDLVHRVLGPSALPPLESNRVAEMLDKSMPD